MPRQRLVLIMGAVLALITVFLVKVWMDQQRAEMETQIREKMEQMQENLVSVLVAREEIPAGSTIAADSVQIKSLPKEYVAAQAVASLARIDGMVTTTTIFKDEQISMTKLAYAQQGSLAEVTPVGKRAVTISVDNIASLAGMVKPGNYVDVIVMVPVPVQTPEGKQVSDTKVIPLFQNVLVLAVGQQTKSTFQQETRYSKEEEREISDSPLITLALTPTEANLLAFIQEQGKIRLVMRNPSDAKTEPTQITGWENLFQYVLPPEVYTPGKSGEAGEYVEIYRGLNKEKVPLRE